MHWEGAERQGADGILQQRQYGLDARHAAQVDLQAQARVHRLGQTKQVMVAICLHQPSLELRTHEENLSRC
jgi:hypothetical protein